MFPGDLRVVCTLSHRRAGGWSTLPISGAGTANQREEASGPPISAWRTTACSNPCFGVGFFGGGMFHSLRIRSRKRVQPGWVS
jgi:hypothetical protein